MVESYSNKKFHDQFNQKTYKKTYYSKNKENPSKNKQLRPNYFFGIRINSSDIKENVENIQREIVQFDPNLACFLIDSRTLHITLFVLSLNDSDDIAKAIEIFQEKARFLIQEIFLNKKLLMTFCGLDTFGKNDVFFSKPDPSESDLIKLNQFTKLLYAEYVANGFIDSKYYDFKPHLTIFKTSKSRDKIKIINNGRMRKDWIQNQLYNHLWNHDQKYKDMTLGSCWFNEIQLLAMGEKETDGYYKSIKTIIIDEHEDQMISPTYSSNEELFPWNSKKYTSQSSDVLQPLPQRKRQERKNNM